MKLVDNTIFRCNDIDLALVDSSGNRWGAVRTKNTYPFWMTTGGYVHYESDGKLVGRWSLVNHPFSDDDMVEGFLCGLSLGPGTKPITEDYYNTLLRRNDLIKHISGRFILYENPSDVPINYSMSLSTGPPSKAITRRKTRNIKIGTRKNLIRESN